jgi:hypothetical protein
VKGGNIWTKRDAASGLFRILHNDERVIYAGHIPDYYCGSETKEHLKARHAGKMEI